MRRHLTRVVDRALSGTPTIITRHGREEAVVMDHSEYLRPRCLAGEPRGGAADRDGAGRRAEVSAPSPECVARCACTPSGIAGSVGGGEPEGAGARQPPPGWRGLR
ncbi:type II toxin-antitoxin system Phd/YefM family antitoxin [Kitasatospora sp. NPDC097605]|uniref:type II toxin-antitoxin system Phd/YefM family antitoxin n=1 Tax=Kitasatospora sp. NPDC097605 TaxID=3157226 RepID=UPI0033333F72